MKKILRKILKKTKTKRQDRKAIKERYKRQRMKESQNNQKKTPIQLISPTTVRVVGNVDQLAYDDFLNDSKNNKLSSLNTMVLCQRANISCQLEAFTGIKIIKYLTGSKYHDPGEILPNPKSLTEIDLTEFDAKDITQIDPDCHVNLHATYNQQVNWSKFEPAYIDLKHNTLHIQTIAGPEIYNFLKSAYHDNLKKVDTLVLARSYSLQCCLTQCKKLKNIVLGKDVYPPNLSTYYQYFEELPNKDNRALTVSSLSRTNQWFFLTNISPRSWLRCNELEVSNICLSDTGKNKCEKFIKEHNMDLSIVVFGGNDRK